MREKTLKSGNVFANSLLSLTLPKSPKCNGNTVWLNFLSASVPKIPPPPSPLPPSLSLSSFSLSLFSLFFLFPLSREREKKKQIERERKKEFKIALERERDFFFSDYNILYFLLEREIEETKRLDPFMMIPIHYQTHNFLNQINLHMVD